MPFEVTSLCSIEISVFTGAFSTNGASSTTGAFLTTGASSTTGFGSTVEFCNFFNNNIF